MIIAICQVVASAILLRWNKSIRLRFREKAGEEELPFVQVQSPGRVSYAESRQALWSPGLL